MSFNNTGEKDTPLYSLSSSIFTINLSNQATFEVVKKGNAQYRFLQYKVYLYWWSSKATASIELKIYPKYIRI